MVIFLFTFNIVIHHSESVSRNCWSSIKVANHPLSPRVHLKPIRNNLEPSPNLLTQMISSFLPFKKGFSGLYANSSPLPSFFLSDPSLPWKFEKTILLYSFCCCQSQCLFQILLRPIIRQNFPMTDFYHFEKAIRIKCLWKFSVSYHIN